MILVQQHARNGTPVRVTAGHWAGQTGHISYVSIDNRRCHVALDGGGKASCSHNQLEQIEERVA